MTAVAVVAHHEREEAAVLARSAVGWLRERGHDAWVVPDDAAVLDLDDLVDERPLTSADLLVCLGGDGTMLRAASRTPCNRYAATSAATRSATFPIHQRVTAASSRPRRRPSSRCPAARPG